MGGNGSSKGVIESLLIHAQGFHSLAHKPLSSLLVETRRVSKVCLRITVFRVPVGMNDHNIVPFNLRPRLFQILRSDDLPFLFRNVHDHARAIVAVKRDFVGVRCPLKNVGGRIGVGGTMHKGRDLLGEDSRFRMIVKALDLPIGKVRAVDKLVG